MQVFMIKKQRAVAIGNSAGENNQGSCAVAVGQGAGQTDQQDLTVAVGTVAGQNNQGEFCSRYR